jgi:hypothetical protein
MLTLVASTSAYAEHNSLWGAAAATCTPGDPAIQGDRYSVVAGSVKHAAGRSGPITLYCPLHAPMRSLQNVALAGGFDFAAAPLSPNVLRLTYRDPDGTSTASNVEAQVIGMSKNDGTIFTVPGATLNSNSFSSTGSGSRSTNKFTHTFDFSNNYYYVRVDVNRGAGVTAEAVFYGVALQRHD